MRLHSNPDFRSISPNESVKKGTLVWLERTESCPVGTGFLHKVQGPFVITDGWGPSWFGSTKSNNPSKDYVKLVSTNTGYEHYVTFGSFLYETYYIIDEEKLCIDAETK